MLGLLLWVQLVHTKMHKPKLLLSLTDNLALNCSSAPVPESDSDSDSFSDSSDWDQEIDVCSLKKEEEEKGSILTSCSSNPRNGFSIEELLM